MIKQRYNGDPDLYLPGILKSEMYSKGEGVNGQKSKIKGVCPIFGCNESSKRGSHVYTHAKHNSTQMTFNFQK